MVTRPAGNAVGQVWAGFRSNDKVRDASSKGNRQPNSGNPGLSTTGAQHLTSDRTTRVRQVQPTRDDGPLASPLRWAGSKRSLIPKIKGMIPTEYERYIEPFAGSACLFFALRPASAVLADNNEALIETFRHLRSHVDEVIYQLNDYDDTGKDYYKVRCSFNSNKSSPEKAAQFLYLNRFGFNGVYRTNRRGHYNVPRGTRTGGMTPEWRLRAISESLSEVDLLCQDFRTTIEMARDGDFLYVDPPYPSAVRPTYGEYGYGSFAGNQDIQDIAHALEEATSRGVKILLSFGSFEGFTEILRGWRVSEFQTRRRISAKLATRDSLHSEILATNY